AVLDSLAAVASHEVEAQGIDASRIDVKRSLHLKYDGTDTTLEIALPPSDEGDARVRRLVADFEARYRVQYGFLMPDKPLVIEAAGVEAIGAAATVDETAPAFAQRKGGLASVKAGRVFMSGAWRAAPVYSREDLRPGDRVAGP